MAFACGSERLCYLACDLNVTQFRKYFTREEARALLPELRELFAQVHQARAEVSELDFELAQQLAQTGGDSGGARVAAMAGAVGRLYGAMAAVYGLGVQVKDIERGLVDFPAWRDGQEVFLCWELDEKDIGHWHDLHAGYAGRKEL